MYATNLGLALLVANFKTLLLLGAHMKSEPGFINYRRSQPKRMFMPFYQSYLLQA